MKAKDSWQKSVQRLLCCLICLTLMLGLLPAGALATDTTSAEATTHHTEDGFDRVLIPSTALDSDTGWTKTKGSNNITVADGAVTFKGSGDNHIAWSDKIEADRFMISMDVTVSGTSTDAEDLKVEFFKADQSNKGDRVVVRFKFSSNNIKIGKLDSDNTNQNCTEDQTYLNPASFTWTTGTPIAIDILVDKTAGTIAVYVDGELKGTGSGDLSAFEQGYFSIGGQYAAQNFSVSGLTVTTDEEGTTTTDPATSSKHINGLVYTLVDDGFDDPEKWDCIIASNATADTASVTVADGKGTIISTAAAKNNCLGWKGGKIDGDNLVISLDLTINEGNTNANAKIAFRAKGDGSSNGAGVYEGDRIQLTFDFPNSQLYLQRLGGTESFTSDKVSFIQTIGQTYAVDIKMIDQTITVYIDGEQVLSYTDEQIGTMEAGNFAVMGQFTKQNFSVDNVKITTDKVGAEHVEGEQEQVVNQHYLEALGRVLAEDNFENADNWVLSPNSSSSVTVAGNQATIKGSGKNNRMDWALGAITADKFLIQFDLTPGTGNTNSNIKVEFKCSELGGGEWLQLRMLPNSSQQQALIQKSDNHDTGSTQLATYADTGTGNFTVLKTGETACFDILVDGDTITVYVNGNAEPVLTAQSEEIAQMARGYIGFEGEYPGQDFSISNFKVTTDEVRDPDSRLSLVVKAEDGGSVNVVSGYDDITEDGTYLVYPGDVVTLEALPEHGYVFAGYTTNTDGLITIPDTGKFAMEAPRGGGTLEVTATFKTREASRFELWYDDFGYEKLNDDTHDQTHNDNRYTLTDAESATVSGGVLTLSGTNYAQIPDEVSQKLAGRNYRISVDSWKADTTSGTMQIMFRGDGFNDRYVLVLNGEVALFRHIVVGGSNTELAKATFTYDGTATHIELEVIGDTVTFYANGSEILSYTTEDNWGGSGNAVGLVNMTGNAPVCFDNFVVEIIPTSVSITAQGTVDGQADDSYTAGTVLPNVPTAISGDEITLDVIVKAGYKLVGYTALAPYEDLVISEDGTFTVPDGASEPINIVANFVSVELPDAREYYIDSVGGNDSNPGTRDLPWKSLIPLQTTVLNPGDTVYLKRGSQFNGQQLTFQGVGGTAEKCITITAYGEGNSLPQLNGQGAVTNVVELWNTPYVTIENLEITNTSPKYNADWSAPNLNSNKSELLRAINIYAKNFGVVSGIVIRNCYIHDINGSNSAKWNGGIFFDIQASGVIDGAIYGIPTKYDSCLIENNTIIKVDRSAIKLVSSVWCNQSLTNSSNPINWYPSTNMVVRGNYMEYIGGDGITVRDVDGTIVEHNLAKDCDYQYATSTYNVAIWPFEAANTVIQYNEAYNTHSTLDGEGFDCDHLSSYTVMQYNYSHNNEGGFMLIMGQWLHTSVTIRYNISQNDRDKVFEFVRGIPKGTMIYNNTFYSDTTLARGILWRPNNDGSAVGNNDLYIFNNLFIFPEDTAFYAGATDGCLNDMISAAKLYNNGYVGIAAPHAEENAVTAADAATVLVGAGSAPETHEGIIESRTGMSGLLNGYELADGSPMIDAGVTLEAAIAHFNTGSLELIDKKSVSPESLYNEAYGTGGGASIQYVNANPLALPGVSYDVDFFGNSNLAGSAPDIGAAEYEADHVHILVYVEATEATCTEEGNIGHWICVNCDKLFADAEGKEEIAPEDIVIAKSAHAFGDWHITKEATADEPGIRERSCSVCGETETETIPATGAENPSEPTEPETTEPDGTADGTNPKEGDDAILLLPAGLMLACALTLLYLNRKKRVK